MKVHSIFSGSALLCLALLNGFLIFSARPLSAETLSSQAQVQSQANKLSKIADEAAAARVAMEAADSVKLSETPVAEATTAEPPEVPVVTHHYVATAYSLRGRTASGAPVSKGIIAADPRLLPLGSRVKIEAGAWSGEYLVADTGGMVRGKRIDIWTPSTREAMRFGRRTVKLTILSLGGKKRPSPRPSS